MNTLLLAATDVHYAAYSDTDFWSSSIGGIIKGLLFAMGIIVVIIAIFKTVKDVLAGSPGKAVKTVLWSAVLAALMFKPELVTQLIHVIGNALDSLFKSADDVVNKGGGGGKAGA